MVTQQEFTHEELVRKAELLKVLGHPERLAIVLLVSRKELCVKELVKELKISQPKVSQHVGLMKELGILSFKKEGTRVLYKLADEKVGKITKILFAQ